MKHLDEALNQTQADQFGRASAALLTQGAQSLPAGIKDRLHAARMKALSMRKAERFVFKNQYSLVLLATSHLAPMACGIP